MLSHKLNNKYSVKSRIERNMAQDLVVCDFCINTHILAKHKVSVYEYNGLLLLKQRPFFVGN